MRAVVQRVTSASVTVEGKKVSEIGKGFMVLLGVQKGDTVKDAEYLAAKTVKLRVFEDENDKMNLSVKDIGGQVLSVSQFTLLGDARGQNRPGFTEAELPEPANELYCRYCEEMEKLGVSVQRGIFRTHMEVALVNDGPVTILLDSKKNF